MNGRKLVFLVTEDSYFYSHRLPMARAAQNAGLNVAVITNVSRHRAAIEDQGIRVIPLSLERRSLNPFKALLHIRWIAAVYRREKPDIVHHIGMKPVLYGSLAAWLAGVPRTVNAFAGMGYVFTAEDMRARILRPLLLLLFRWLLRRPGSHLLLQNDDDRALLERYGLIDNTRTHVIRGSGVDLVHFTVQKFQTPAPDFKIVFSGRMIGIKGLETLKDAFALLAVRAPGITLWLCGAPDPANPGSWTVEQLRHWDDHAPNVIYKGHCADMAAVWAQAHAAVQPSWGGEGVPMALLEAAACGRAIVASDVPGCRDVVEEGRNGWLAPPRNAEALAGAIMKLAQNAELCETMGRASRELVAEKGFSGENVGTQAEALYRSLL